MAPVSGCEFASWDITTRQRELPGDDVGFWSLRVKHPMAHFLKQVHTPNPSQIVTPTWNQKSNVWAYARPFSFLPQVANTSLQTPASGSSQHLWLQSQRSRYPRLHRCLDTSALPGQLHLRYTPSHRHIMRVKRLIRQLPTSCILVVLQMIIWVLSDFGGFFLPYKISYKI